MQSLRDFYKNVLAMPVSEPFGARVRLLSGAHDLDLEYRHPLAMASLPKDFGIELDEYPPSATTRAQRFGELPPGMAMVGFKIASLKPVEESLLAAPAIACRSALTMAVASACCAARPASSSNSSKATEERE